MDMIPDCVEHEYYNNGDGIFSCMCCGLKSEDILVDDSFDMLENRNGVSGWRYNIRKNDDSSRSLYSELINIGVPIDIIDKANYYYSIIISNKIYRAKNRISIIFACVYYAYIDKKDPKNANILAKQFNLTKKKISGGLRKFSHVFKNKEISVTSGQIDDVLTYIHFKENTKVSHSIYLKIINDINLLFKYVSENIIEGLKELGMLVVMYYLKLIGYPYSIELEGYCNITKKKEQKLMNKIESILGKKMFTSDNDLSD